MSCVLFYIFTVLLFYWQCCLLMLILYIVFCCLHCDCLGLAAIKWFLTAFETLNLLTYLQLQLQPYSTLDYRPDAGVGGTALHQCRADSNQPTWKTCADSVGRSPLAMLIVHQEYDGWAYITAPLSTSAQLSLFTGTDRADICIASTHGVRVMRSKRLKNK